MRRIGRRTTRVGGTEPWLTPYVAWMGWNAAWPLQRPHGRGGLQLRGTIAGRWTQIKSSTPDFWRASNADLNFVVETDNESHLLLLLQLGPN